MLDEQVDEYCGMPEPPKYSHVTYGIAKVLLISGWYTPKQLEDILSLMKKHNEALEHSIKQTYDKSDNE